MNSRASVVADTFSKTGAGSSTETPKNGRAALRVGAAVDNAFRSSAYGPLGSARQLGLFPGTFLEAMANPKEPNLLRDFFPEGKVPRVHFDGVSVPRNLPKEIWTTDTTFRDGQQSRAPYTVEQVVEIYKLLHRLSGKGGAVRQSEFFLYGKKDREAVQKCIELGYEFPEITAWIRANEKDLALVKEMGIKETGILTSISDYLVYKKLNLDRKSAAEKYLKIVNAAIDSNIIPRCHFEDVTRADPEFVIAFASMLMEVASERGCPVKIRLCDTLGHGVPYAEAALPISVPKLIDAMVRIAGVPSEWLEWHGHNDFGNVHIDGTASWLYGCSALNTSLLGLGERTGNPPTELAILELARITGVHENLEVITEIAEFYREIGTHIAHDKPAVGSAIFETRAGVHIDALNKWREAYLPFAPALLGRTPDVVITNVSGAAGVAAWVELHAEGVGSIDKTDPRIVAMAAEIGAQYENGRVIDMSGDEMLALCRQHNIL